MSLPEIHNKIFEIKELKIVVDFDLAELYEVETRLLNEQAKSNTDKFPQDFMFMLTEKKWEIQLVANCDEFKKAQRQSLPPYAFTKMELPC